MEVKVSFDREKLEKWFNEDCGIECEDCPLEGYMCDTLLATAYVEEFKKIWKDNNKEGVVIYENK